MELHFTKMHGCGNDFVVIDATRDLRHWQPRDEEAAYMLDRRFGIGGDQLIVLYPCDDADARMAIFNADGSEAEMCGNAIRCCALYMRSRGLVDRDELVINTLAGPIRPLIEGTSVRVDMGRPRLDAAAVPVEGYNGRVLDAAPPRIDSDWPLPPMSCVSMGNPHCVFFVDDVATVPIAEVGGMVERHPAFPQRTNVEFAQVLERGRLRVRVWERGSGVTLACGTGACGTVVAAILTDRSDTHVTVMLDGGDLLIEWPDPDGPVWMTGPATEVFNGCIALSGA
jgi:diaminopimelate epimerase